MRISILIEDDQVDKTKKKGRAMMIQVEEKKEKIAAASWLENDSVLGEEINSIVRDIKKLQKKQLSNKKKAQKATDKLIK